MYEIRQTSDMLAGASLIITIEECDLDKKALFTIEETKPGFILPFQTRQIDGKIELIYQVSTLCKLQYFTGEYTVTEYVQLWRNALSPLLECGDWFMKIQSFVLDVEHLFYDKDLKSISFIYIPTNRECSQYEDLKKMIGELARQIQVADIVLENKIFRMIMNDINPKEFLNMLNDYIPEAEQRVMVPSKKEPPSDLSLSEFQQIEELPMSLPKKEFKTNLYVDDSDCPKRMDSAFAGFENEEVSNPDIVINMQQGGKDRKKQKKENKSKNKSEKRKKKESAKTKGSEKANIIEEDSAFIVNKNLEYDKAALVNRFNPSQNNHLFMENEPLDDATQCVGIADSACTLRLIGSPLLPSAIRVEIEEEGVFTIGRYDATVGRKQSSFEFERKTKAISRRHAVIKKHMERYSLIDLSSSAGTFLNGQKLPPNTPFELENGARISFGTSGADYVFEKGEKI